MPNQHCVDDFIKTWTSLPPVTNPGTPTSFDDYCREFVELYSKAIARRVEQFNRRRKQSGNTNFPPKIKEWCDWAAGRIPNHPGLPDCLDLTTVSNAVGETLTPDASNYANAPIEVLNNIQYLNATARVISSSVMSLQAFDIDDWNDQ